MTPVVDVRHLSVCYGSGIALQDLDWTVTPGSFWAVVGPNGSGKTTLLKAVLGLLPPRTGTLLLFGDTPQAFNAWHRVGYLPQFADLTFQRFPATVQEIVVMGRLAAKRFPRRLIRQDHLAAREALARMSIADLSERQIGALSGGQRQRVLLARARVNQPDLLLLDEPGLALDPDSRERFYELLETLNREQGTAIVLVTHDSATAGKHAEQLLYLDRKPVFQGSFADFCESSHMAAHFGAHAQHIICHQHGPPQQ